MKIAIDITPIKGNNSSGHKVRGAGKYIELLLNNVSKHDKDNTYIFFTREENLPKDIDIIHYPYFEPFFLTLPFFKNNIKTIVTVHDLIPLLFPKHFPVGLKGSVKWKIQKQALKNSSAIITDSVSSKNDISDIVGFDKEKINVVYLAVSENFKRLKEDSKQLEIVKNKYKLPRKFVLYVGDVTWNKNLPNLVKAIKETNIPLVMTGKALVSSDFDRSNLWNNDLIKVLSEIEGNENFIRLGFLSEEDLIAVYNLATVSIMPSLYEGFGFPVLEAMTCGCPVIISKNSSLPEVGGEAVFYINPNNASEISDAINKIFSNKKLQEDLSRKGLDQAKKFSISKTINETIDVYNNLT